MIKRSLYFSHKQHLSEGGLYTSWELVQPLIGLVNQCIERKYLDNDYDHSNNWDSGPYFNASKFNTSLKDINHTYCWPAKGELPWTYPFDLMEHLYDTVTNPKTLGDGTLVDEAPAEVQLSCNRLFHRFNLPYEMREGHIISLSSRLLDEMVLDFDFPFRDDELKNLIMQAKEAYYDRNSNRKLDGLKHIVDALDRIKSHFGRGTKSQETALAGRLAITEILAPKYCALFDGYRNVSNNFTIRHHEIDKPSISDELTVETLFFSCFALVRFIHLAQSTDPKFLPLEPKEPDFPGPETTEPMGEPNEDYGVDESNIE